MSELTTAELELLKIIEELKEENYNLEEELKLYKIERGDKEQ